MISSQEILLAVLTVLAWWLVKSVAKGNGITVVELMGLDNKTTVEIDCPYTDEQMQRIKAFYQELMKKEEPAGTTLANQSSLGLQAQAKGNIPDNS